MSYRIFLLGFLCFSGMAYAQFKNDNVLYKTVDPGDLCSALNANKGYLLLDVRSKGEHFDTASQVVYNLGHFKGAQNIDINELDKRWNEIQDYKDKPVFIYCSHSQRSRRASKMLADSGFTKVYNINGGLSAFHYLSLKDDGCISSLYETNNKYRIISFNELCERKQKGDPYIIDVRSDSAFRHIHTDSKVNATGIIKGSVNIPLTSLQNNTASLPAKDREIIITDLSGGDAAKSAALLSQQGFKNVSMLVEGVDRILSLDPDKVRCKDIYASPVAYKISNAIELGRYIKTHPDVVFLDIRTEDEFNNRHKDYWRNIGNIKNAFNIPAEKLATSVGSLDKNREFVLYTFSGGPEVYKSAQVLTDNGFKNVRVLQGGIFNVRWAAGNVKGQEYLRDLVVNVPEANQ